jgi:hypothetical protein
MDKVRNFFYSKNRNSKSVRKNCFWIEYGNKKYLVSYKTIVCSIDDRGKFERYWNNYSVTTLNQINRFIKLFDKDFVIRSDTGEIINGFNKNEWEGMEVSSYCAEAYGYIKPYMPDIEYNDRNDYVKHITYNC